VKRRADIRPFLFFFADYRIGFFFLPFAGEASHHLRPFFSLKKD